MHVLQCLIILVKGEGEPFLYTSICSNDEKITKLSRLFCLQEVRK